MALAEETELVGKELDAFLARQETGVLALANDDEPYAIPISFGFNSSQQRFFMRLVSTPGSEKRQYLGSSPSSRLVVYDSDGDVYQSAVAYGQLEEISREELTIEHVEQYGETKRPLFEIWGDSRRELEIQLYQLAPTELSGRRAVVERE